MKWQHLLQVPLFASALHHYALVSAQGGGDVIAETICGPTDDRVLSFDFRQGRLVMPGTCTAWLISEDVFLTAGHCGAPNENWRVHFTFDAHAAQLEDQYAVETHPASYGARYSPSQGLDWAVGRLLPNNITGLLPGVAQSAKCGTPGCGWYRIGSVPSQALGNSVTITGYGRSSVPGDSFLQPQKSSTSALKRITSTQLFYTTDSMPGNSGGPILDALTDKAIGIHTTSGCDQGGGTNSGTRIDVPEVMQHISLLMDTSPTGKPTTLKPPTTAKPTSKRLTRSPTDKPTPTM